MNAIDSRDLRRTLGAFTTGVTVVTTLDADGKPFGVTANSFSSVSLDPPLILWSQSLTSSSYPAFRDGDRFVVNILADHQVAVSNQFAKSGADKFAGVAYRDGLGGLPVLDDCAAYLECRKVAAYPGGDHVIFVGHVENMHRAGRRPLAFGEGRYRLTLAHDLGEGAGSAGDAGSNLSVLRAVRHASLAMPEICEQIGNRTLGLAVWGNQGATIVRWEPSSMPVSSHLQTGVVVSLTQSATGNAFAAFMASEAVRTAVDEAMEKDADAFADRLEAARKHGLARAVGSLPSSKHEVVVNAFSAPVYDASGAMVLALSTTCEAERLSEDWDGPVPIALRQAADSLSRRLGWKD